MNEIRGISVSARGTYVLFDDVLEAIEAYAKAGPKNDQEVVLDLLAWLRASDMPSTQIPGPAGGFDEVTNPEIEPKVSEASVPYGAEEDDVTEGVARVEIYPDPPEDPRPKWYARTVDTGGYILKVTEGSFDQEFVIQNAQERFPGVEIFLLKNAGQDSKWTEDSTRGVFPSKGPPLRRLFAGAGR